MKLLEEYVGTDVPLPWINLERYPKSKAVRMEIYSEEDDSPVQVLKNLFFSLFDTIKDELVVYNKRWWGFCIEVWNVQDDLYDYDLAGKTPETQTYLTMLLENDIAIDFRGNCIVKDWDQFLSVILPCVAYHAAPYSPLLCSVKNDFFFYFHYSGSLGLYYREPNSTINSIIHVAESMYDVIYRPSEG